MKSITSLVVCGLLVGGAIAIPGAPVEAAPQGQGRHQKVGATSGGGAQVSVGVVFAAGEVQVLREYYAPRVRNLPPGLRRKLRRTGQLPPGWQKKFEPFPVTIERQLAPLPSGYTRGFIDGHAVIFNSRTHVILDVAVLF